MNKEDIDKKLAKWEAKAKLMIKWVTVNASGDVWGYDKKLKVNKETEEWLGYGAETVHLGKINNKGLCKNWDKTLRKVNYE